MLLDFSLNGKSLFGVPKKLLKVTNLQSFFSYKETKRYLQLLIN